MLCVAGFLQERVLAAVQSPLRHSCCAMPGGRMVGLPTFFGESFRGSRRSLSSDEQPRLTLEPAEGQSANRMSLVAPVSLTPFAPLGPQISVNH